MRSFYYSCGQKLCLFIFVVLPCISLNTFGADLDPRKLKSLETAFSKEIQPLLKTYCHECHSKDTQEAELDLSLFTDFSQVRKTSKAWQKIGEMLESDQMPPKESKQPTADEQEKLRGWVHDYLTVEAAANAGDPGPVILRRLSNAEYKWTLRDLTGINSLEPAKGFPVDSGAGEGFTNVGNALVMSPTLLTKYLDSAKDVADHAVLLPDGMRFSPTKTRRDWINESLANIRGLYGKYSTPQPATETGPFDLKQGGRLPIEDYLAATLEEREALQSGRKKIADVARLRNLSPKYLELLWNALNQYNDGNNYPLTELQSKWRRATSSEAKAIASSIIEWQKRLWKFNTVGQIGRIGGPKSWMEATSPVVSQLDLRAKVPSSLNDDDLVLYLSADHFGEETLGGIAIWERPRFEIPGRPDLLLRDVRKVAGEFMPRRTRFLAQVENCLNAIADAQLNLATRDIAFLAQKYHVDEDLLAGWLKYLGITNDSPKVHSLLDRKLESIKGNHAISGWGGEGLLCVVANSSNDPVRIPGIIKPNGIIVHPTEKNCAVVNWQSPSKETVTISGGVQTTNSECGNGVVWALELWRGNLRIRLGDGIVKGKPVVPLGVFKNIVVETGDMISLIIDSRRGHETCDWTAVDLRINDGNREWDLARDVSANFLEGNPHSDSHNNKNVWQFSSIPTSSFDRLFFAESLLGKWILASGTKKAELAKQIHSLLNEGTESLAKKSLNIQVYNHLTSLSGPLSYVSRQSTQSNVSNNTEATDSKYGLASELFGTRADAPEINDASLSVKIPSFLEVRIPAVLVKGAEFVTDATVQGEASTQMNVAFSKPKKSSIVSGESILVAPASATRKQMEKAFNEFRMLFPPTLCYSKIVPTDEPITLNLYYREDEHLRRLMLSEEEKKTLDQLWEELFFIAQEPLEKVGVYEQFMEYSTQDRPDLVKEVGPLRQGILDRAAAFRKQLIDSEQKQFNSLIEFAAKAYRRQLSDDESQLLRSFYTNLRSQEISHDEAFRLTLSRLLVSPAFLYRLEKTGPGTKPLPVNDWELASRLSYFLWSSLPDEELRKLAKEGKLQNAETLANQAKRMMRDPKSRRLATEFGCQWLHIYNFEHHNEKSERHFPVFASLRGAMFEESILFFADLIQNDRSVLNLLDSDYTFLNEDLAQHYGIPNVKGSDWRRVDGVRQFGRGGVLSQATVLSKQSGASRTSPVLRGAWISEVLLGEKLPRPPKNVPQLADAAPEGLTERQLFERHSSDARCMKCHVRIDPFGFALENYDAIGRFREKSGETLIDSKSMLPDKTSINGINGLQTYLATTRRDAFIRQFSRKLLGYSLGRSVQLSDEPLITEMQTVLAKNNYQISSAVELIVRSPQFRNIRGAEAAKD